MPDHLGHAVLVYAAGSYGHAHAPNGPPQIPESLNRAGNLDGDNCDAPETNHWMLPSPSDAETTLDAKQTHQQMDKKMHFSQADNVAMLA